MRNKYNDIHMVDSKGNTLTISYEDFRDFLNNNIDYSIISDIYESDIDTDLDNRCYDCDDICDYEHKLESYQDEIYELKSKIDSNARDIVFEYMKLNTLLPIEIIKELGKDEVYKIIERLDWHV